jgi:hypothetical protein
MQLRPRTNILGRGNARVIIYSVLFLLSAVAASMGAGGSSLLLLLGTAGGVEWVAQRDVHSQERK